MAEDFSVNLHVTLYVCRLETGRSFEVPPKFRLPVGRV